MIFTPFQTLVLPQTNSTSFTLLGKQKVSEIRTFNKNNPLSRNEHSHNYDHQITKSPELVEYVRAECFEDLLVAREGYSFIFITYRNAVLSHCYAMTAVG